jgi:hypothetical protein
MTTNQAAEHSSGRRHSRSRRSMRGHGPGLPRQRPKR